MTDGWTTRRLEEFLAGAVVGREVATLRPDYRALLIAVDGLTPGAPSAPVTATGDGDQDLLTRAESAATGLLERGPVEEQPHVAAWRETYRSFGAKPQRTRNSLEALLRRAAGGLPRVNPLTDTYNALSVLHLVPLGGEDLNQYAGPPRLVRASGDETMQTMAHGEEAVEHPEPGEVVWRDDEGVTCRRWNWRQCRRTQLTTTTTAALFILDALAPMTDEALRTAGDELIGHLDRLGAEVRWASRIVTWPAVEEQP